MDCGGPSASAPDPVRAEGLLVAAAAALWLGARLGPGRVTGAIGTDPPWSAWPLAASGLLLLGLTGGLALRGRCRPMAVVIVATSLVGLVLAGAMLADRADAGYRPRAPGRLDGEVTVLDDPHPVGVAGWRVEVRLADGGRVEATGYGRPGGVLARAGVGDVLAVDGRLREVGDRPWLRTRHIVARASIAGARPVRGPGPLRAAVEAVRDRVGAGADPLGERQAALYRGLVLGDDRFQPLGQRLRFRVAGLSHLLAVSGQNVAFVLAAAGPLLRSLGHRTRLAGLLGLVALFAVITRLEPSVLRAAATASIAAWAAWSGRGRSGPAVLAVAVMGLVVVDPFLVEAVGFQLSVAASAGILLLGPALARRLPGPPPLVQPLATTLGAQAGVAPILAAHFGPMSLVAVPANLAAGWAAAGVMTWGMSVGVVAGLLPPTVGAVVQLPVRAMLLWLELVAAAGARLPGPRPSPVLLLAMATLAVVARDLRARWLTAIAATVGLVAIVLTVPRAPDRPATCGAGFTWYPGDGQLGRSVLIVGDDAGPSGLDDCLAAGVGEADLVVVERGDRDAGRLVAASREVMTVGEVWAPPQHVVVGARRRLDGARVTTGRAVLDVLPDEGGRRLHVIPVYERARARQLVSRPEGRSAAGPHP